MTELRFPVRENHRMRTPIGVHAGHAAAGEASTEKATEPVSRAEISERAHAACVRSRELRVAARAIMARAEEVLARSREHARQFQSNCDAFKPMAGDRHHAPRAVVAA